MHLALFFLLSVLPLSISTSAEEPSLSRLRKKSESRRFKLTAIPKLFEKLKSNIDACNDESVRFLEAFNRFGDFLTVAHDNDRAKFLSNEFAQFSQGLILALSMDINYRIADLRETSEAAVMSLSLSPSENRTDMLHSIISASATVQGILTELVKAIERLDQALATKEPKTAEQKKDKYFKNLQRIILASNELGRAMKESLKIFDEFMTGLGEKIEEYRTSTTSTPTTSTSTTSIPTTSTTTTTSTSTTSSTTTPVTETTSSTTIPGKSRLPIYSKSGKFVGYYAPWAKVTPSPATTTSQPL